MKHNATAKNVANLFRGDTVVYAIREGKNNPEMFTGIICKTLIRTKGELIPIAEDSPLYRLLITLNVGQQGKLDRTVSGKIAEVTLLEVHNHKTLKWYISTLLSRVSTLFKKIPIPRLNLGNVRLQK